MELLLLLLFVGLPTGAVGMLSVIVAGAAAARRRPDRRLEDYTEWWKQAASALGAKRRGHQLSTMHRGRRVWVTYAPHQAVPSDIEVTMGLADEGIAVRPRRSTRGGVRTGDPQFDRALVVEGGPERLLAMLGEDQRRLLVRLVRRAPFEVSGGAVRYTLAGRPSIEGLGATVDALADVADALTLEGGVREALTRRALTDREPGVRIAALGALRRFGDSEVARQLCEDPDPVVQVMAAERVGRLDVLQAVGEDERVPVWARLRAIEAAVRLEVAGKGHAHGVDRGLALLLRRADTRKEALRLVRLGRVRSLAGEVVAVARGSRDRDEPELVRVATDALAVLADPDTEPALVELLAMRSAAVQVGAARALAAMGTVAAVPALKSVADARLANTAVRQAAREAIDAIQGRARGEVGGLALAVEDGRLSPADEGGGLSSS